MFIRPKEFKLTDDDKEKLRIRLKELNHKVEESHHIQDKEGENWYLDPKNEKLLNFIEKEQKRDSFLNHL